MAMLDSICKSPPIPRPTSRYKSTTTTSLASGRDPSDSLYEGYNDYDPQLHHLHMDLHSEVCAHVKFMVFEP